MLVAVEGLPDLCIEGILPGDLRIVPLAALALRAPVAAPQHRVGGRLEGMAEGTLPDQRLIDPFHLVADHLAAAEVQDVVQSVCITEIVTVEVVLCHPAGVLRVGKGHAHAFHHQVGELPAGKTPSLAGTEVIGLAPEALRHPVFADIGHADAALDGGRPFQHVVGRLMEDDGFLPRTVVGGVLSGLPDGDPVLQTAFKDGKLAEHLADGVVIVDGGVDGVATASHLHRVLPVAGLCHRAHIDKVDVIGIGLLLNGLDDGQGGTDVGVQGLFRVLIRRRGDHGTDVQHIIRASHAALDASKVCHIAPDHFQHGVGHLFQQGTVFIAGPCQHTHLEAGAACQQLLDGLLTHRAGSTGDER